MSVPGHKDMDLGHSDHCSGVVAFYCTEANQIYETIKEKTQKEV